jgi:hypothetical protein
MYAGLQHTKSLSQHAILVRRKVDHAIGNNHVDRIVWQGDMFDFALEELDILRASFAFVLIGQGEHLVRHIETVCLAGGANPLRGKQHIDAAA